MDFCVERKDVSKGAILQSGPLVLENGEVLICIEKFAFTSNVVSYSTAGESLKYWDHFPVAGEKYARTPTWGIGVVVASRADGIPPGERIYGFFPMSTFTVLQPGNIMSTSFVDKMENRNGLPVVYNIYHRSHSDMFYTSKHEDLMLIMRPLFFTSWLLNDFVADIPDIEQVIIVSASSKTGYALAYMLDRYRGNFPSRKVIGVTSKTNLDFVQSLKLYDQVLTYDDVTKELQGDRKTAVVDMAGNVDILYQLHEALGNSLVSSTLVGATHFEQFVGVSSGKVKRPTKWPGASPSFFFAPSQSQKRIKELGSQGALFMKISEDWKAFMHDVNEKGWCKIVRNFGPSPVLAGYKQALQPGFIKPNEGLIYSMLETLEVERCNALSVKVDARI